MLELDGFRALAVWMVLFDHMVDGWRLPPESTVWMPRILWQFVAHGWLGVDLFFVLSGFLITGILYDSRNESYYFKNFYGRRALRIIPLYFTCIAIMYVCYGGPYFSLALLFIANFAPAFGVATPHGPGVFWSLSIEEHFYLVWPFAVRLLGSRALLALAITIVVGSPVLRWLAVGAGISAEGVYQFSQFRLDGLALGACLALWARSRHAHRRGSLVLAISLLSAIAVVTLATLHLSVLGTGTRMGVALRSTQAQFLFATSVALALAFRGSKVTAPLRCKFALLSARLSYCIYLIHLSVGDFYYWTLRQFNVDQFAVWGPVGALAMRSVVIIGASFALSALSQRFLEAPFMKLRRHFA